MKLYLFLPTGIALFFCAGLALAEDTAFNYGQTKFRVGFGYSFVEGTNRLGQRLASYGERETNFNIPGNIPDECFHGAGITKINHHSVASDLKSDVILWMFTGNVFQGRELSVSCGDKYFEATPFIEIERPDAGWHLLNSSDEDFRTFLLQTSIMLSRFNSELYDAKTERAVDAGWGLVNISFTSNAHSPVTRAVALEIKTNQLMYIRGFEDNQTRKAFLEINKSRGGQSVKFDQMIDRLGANTVVVKISQPSDSDFLKEITTVYDTVVNIEFQVYCAEFLVSKGKFDAKIGDFPWGSTVDFCDTVDVRLR